jgi:hypothetical protein
VANRTLNEVLTFDAAPADVRRGFRCGRAQKRLLLPGVALYKFTQHPLFDAAGRVTPWWFAVEPLAADDPGLAGALERAKRLGVAPATFVRARAAVTRQWNTLSDLLRVRLLVPVWAFVGRCADQPIDTDPRLANVVFIGGAYQLWVPNLSRCEITAL